MDYSKTRELIKKQLIKGSQVFKNKLNIRYENNIINIITDITILGNNIHNTSGHYTKGYIKKKKSGQYRVLYKPSKQLKQVQRKLLNLFYLVFNPAFITTHKRSSYELANEVSRTLLIHQACLTKIFILKCDLSNAYNSTRRSKVKEKISKKKIFDLINVNIYITNLDIYVLVKYISDFLDRFCYIHTESDTKLCPQGFPTSRLIFDIIQHNIQKKFLVSSCINRLKQIDRSLLTFSIKSFRYCDDLLYVFIYKSKLNTLTRDKIKDTFIAWVKRVYRHEGYTINNKKIKYYFTENKFKVPLKWLGVTIRDNNYSTRSIRLSRKLKNRLRMLEYNGKKGNTVHENIAKSINKQIRNVDTAI